MNPRARLARASRMADLRAKAVDAAQADLARAEGARMEARRTRDALVEAYERAGGELASSRTASAADWVDAEAHLQALSRGRSRAEVALRAAEDVVAQRREVLAAARRAHRAMEMWRDGIQASLRAEADRAERLRADETAARSVRR